MPSHQCNSVLRSESATARYFINFYQVLRFVDGFYAYLYDVEMSKKFNKVYTNMLRARVGQSILLLLAFNCSKLKGSISDDDYFYYREILERANFFEHLDLVNIFNSTHDCLSFKELLSDIDEAQKKRSEFPETLDEYDAIEYFRLINSRLSDLKKERDLYQKERIKYGIIRAIVDDYDLSVFGESKFYKPFLDLSQKFRPDLN